MNKQLAYSLLETKALDKSKRVFRGWATRPETDRVGDIVNPLGVKFTNPLVLLHQHNHGSPIGTVFFSKATEKGIEFEATIPVIDEPGLLKDRVDMAWGEIEHGLVRGVSIGFRPIKYAYLDGGGIDFQETEVYELSTVSVPALASATIQTIKALASHQEATRGVRLISVAKAKTENLNGAVRLIRS